MRPRKFELSAFLCSRRLSDSRISARVRSALERHFGSDAGALIKTEVKAGQVILTGQMVDAHYIAEAVRLVRSVEGVTGVESHIVPIGVQGFGIG